jgi:hypothetical protein
MRVHDCAAPPLTRPSHFDATVIAYTHSLRAVNTVPPSAPHLHVVAVDEHLGAVSHVTGLDSVHFLCARLRRKEGQDSRARAHIQNHFAPAMSHANVTTAVGSAAGYQRKSITSRVSKEVAWLSSWLRITCIIETLRGVMFAATGQPAFSNKRCLDIVLKRGT